MRSDPTSSESPVAGVRIFLSHSSRDREWIEPIRDQARAMGVDVYLFSEDMHPGENTAQKLQQALEQCRALVVLLTANSSPSQYVNQEIGYALGRGIPVIPLVEAGAAFDRLAMLQGADYIPFDPTNVQTALTELTRVLHRMQPQVPTSAVRGTSPVIELTQQDVVMAAALVALLLFLAYSAGASFGRP